MNRARAAATALFFINGATFGSWVSRIPDVTRGLGLSERELGLALFGVAAGAIFALPAVVRAVRLVGSRRVCLWTAVTFCATLPLLALASSLPALAGALTLFGAANGALDVSMNDNGGGLERRRGHPIMGTLHAAFSCGGAAGALVGAAVAAAELGPLVHFAAAAAVLALGSLWAGRHLVDVSDAPPAGGWTRPRRSRALLTLLVVGLCAALAEGAVGDWSALYLVETLGASRSVGAIGFVAFSALMVAGRLAEDRLVRRFGGATLRRAGGATAAAGMAAALLAGRPWAAVLALGVVGAGLAVVFPVTMSGASRIAGLAPASGVAVVSGMAYTSLLAGPPLIGLLAEATSLQTALWMVTACLAAVTVLPAAPLITDPAAPTESGLTAA